MKSFVTNLIENLQAPMEPKRFSLFVTYFVVACLAIVGSFNWLVNPYGQYSSDLLAPIVQDSRQEKVDLFEKLEVVPDGLVLGSSRALKFEPAYLQARTSQTFFNFAVNHGRPEDFLAIVRYYDHRFKRLPKTLVVGIDLSSLNDEVPNDARLCVEPRLFEFARDTCSWSEEFDRFSQLFSYQQLNSSIKSIKNCLFKKKQAELEQRFLADGVIQYITREKQISEGKYDFDAALDFSQREFIAVFSKLNAPSTRRLGYLREALRLCKANDCKVYLFATVAHPKLRETLAAKTKFVELEKKSILALESMARELEVNFVDFGAVEKFAGDPNCFVDGIHPLEPNTRRMIDRLFNRPSEASYAVQ